MNRVAIGAVAALLLAAAAPVLAQGGTPAQPPAGTSPPPATPPAGTTPPGPGTATPPATAPAVPEIVTVETPPVVNQPAPQAPPTPAPIDIPLDANYPNGVQDPVDPFANSVRADNDREAGFPWGLLGLLGLLGLIPLVRGYGHRGAAIERERERPLTRRDGE